MVNKKMLEKGSNRSVIRELFEYGKKRKAEVGKQNVFDFSLGNPSVPSPKEVNDTLKNLLETVSPSVLHGYTSAQGDFGVRKSVAEFIQKEYGFNANADLIYLVTGAASGLCSVLTALLNENEEVVVPSPFFPEYSVFVESAGGKLIAVNCKQGSFDLDLKEIERAINEKTKVIIINSPNNPTGVIYSENTIKELSKLLQRKEREFDHEIYLLADEPYRELVYDGETAPYIPNFYENAIVVYSFSKSLSLAGERIGYVMVSPNCKDSLCVYQAILGAGRSLGYVCAPSLFQFLLPSCLGKTADISVYDKNRKLLYNSLKEIGFEVVKPNGAFYLFVKAPCGDAVKFSEKAKEFDLLLVPSNSFGVKGYVRIAYCVEFETIKNSIPAFKKLYLEYEKRG